MLNREIETVSLARPLLIVYAVLFSNYDATSMLSEQGGAV